MELEKRKAFLKIVVLEMKKRRIKFL